MFRGFPHLNDNKKDDVCELEKTSSGFDQIWGTFENRVYAATVIPQSRGWRWTYVASRSGCECEIRRPPAGQIMDEWEQINYEKHICVKNYDPSMKSEKHEVWGRESERRHWLNFSQSWCFKQQCTLPLLRKPPVCNCSQHPLGVYAAWRN